MKSALAIVAYSNSTDLDGVLALLETALIGLDRDGRYLAAGCSLGRQAGSPHVRILGA